MPRDFGCRLCFLRYGVGDLLRGVQLCGGPILCLGLIVLGVSASVGFSLWSVVQAAASVVLARGTHQAPVLCFYYYIYRYL